MRAYKTKSHRHRSNIIPYTKPKYPNVIPDCIGLRLRYKYIFLLFPYPNPQPLAIINFHDWLDFFCRLLANIFFFWRIHTFKYIWYSRKTKHACIMYLFRIVKHGGRTKEQKVRKILPSPNFQLDSISAHSEKKRFPKILFKRSAFYFQSAGLLIHNTLRE